MEKIGLRFEKMDLHVHTPASHDFYPQEGVTPEQVVNKAIEKGLKAIAITDHNTGEWVDKIKQAAKAKDLVIFPGVEVLATGGESGVHIIGIFDIDKGSSHITALLGSLNIKPKDLGKKEAVSSLGPAQVIKCISDEQYGGIAILAHCTSSKGVLGEMRGETRSRVFEEFGLLGVEVNESDFLNDDRSQKGTRAIDLLDGKHEEYRFRKLGVYQASDNRHPERGGSHGIEGIGHAYSYFKIDEPLRLESLRQCLIDRDVRIRQSFEYNPVPFPCIKSIIIDGGFFNPQTFELHEGLNSIIGSKGSGKSLLVECMRFAFGQPPTQQDILIDHDAKLEQKLQEYGKVSVLYLDDAGKEVEFSRKYDVDGGNPVEGVVGESIPRNFPILFLSQNEIIRIASNEDEQLKFIDKFFDFHGFREKLDEIEELLRGQDSSVAECLRAFKEDKKVVAELKEIEKQLAEINKSLASEVLEDIDASEAKRQYIELLEQQTKGFIKILETAKYESLLIDIPEVPDKLSTDQLSMQVNKLANTLHVNVADDLDKYINESKKTVENLVNKKINWLPTFNQIKKVYEDFIKDKGGDVKVLEAKRKHLSTRKEQLVKKQATLKGKVKQLESIKKSRESNLVDLEKTYSLYTEQRKERCRKFEVESNRKLQISIAEGSNKDAFISTLIKLRTGTRIQEPDLQAIANSIPPKDFIANIIRYDLSSDASHLDKIVELCGVTSNKIKLLAEHILENQEYEDILTLQYRVKPQDRPEIRYDVAVGQYELLKDLSTGQKCTAMLLMALSDGNVPIVIDQPEDSLDLKSIWTDMCRRLRKDKDRRQFIFTTHNSSLAVASDTDNYIVLESTAYNGQIVGTGAIDKPKIRKDVISYLEGGELTYLHKYAKYNVSKKPSDGSSED